MLHKLLCSYGDQELFVALCGLLIAMASLGQHGLRLPSFSSFSFPGYIVLVHRLSCSEAHVIFLDQGLNPVSPALAGGFFTTEPPGKPPHPTFSFFKYGFIYFCYARSQLQRVGSSSLTRDGTRAPYIGRVESLPLDYQGSLPTPQLFMLWGLKFPPPNS